MIYLGPFKNNILSLYFIFLKKHPARRTSCYPTSSRHFAPNTLAVCCAQDACSNCSAGFTRGEIDQAALTEAEDEAIKDALALQERVGLKFATDGEFRRRSYHSFFYRQLGDITIDTVGGEATARGGNDRQNEASQPIAVIKSRLQWRHPINVGDFDFLPPNTNCCPRSPFPGRAPCISAAATPRCWRAPTRTWISSGTTPSRPSAASLTRWPPPAAATCRSTRPPSPSSAIPTCRRRSRRAATTGAR